MAPDPTDQTAPSRPCDTLARGAQDYRWLLDRGYPDQQALLLVGDRYRLSGVERGMLYRGVFSSVASRTRERRLVESTANGTLNSDLVVDGHNVLFTIWNCLAGRPIVSATDGFVRDIGGTRCRLPHDHRFSRIARVLCDTVQGLRCSTVTVLLDAQLPWSRDQRLELARIWQELAGTGPEAGTTSARARFTVETNVAVDAVVAAATGHMIATSDTGIIDRCAQPVLDLGGRIVVRAFGTRPVQMAGLCAQGLPEAPEVPGTRTVRAEYPPEEERKLPR